MNELTKTENRFVGFCQLFNPQVMSTHFRNKTPSRKPVDTALREEVNYKKTNEKYKGVFGR